MSCLRINNAVPRVTRVYKTVPINTRNMSLFPRLVANDFAPMFRLMDDYANHVSSRASGNKQSSSSRTFVPKFNVKEEKDRYVLEGELPGVVQSNVTIEFTESNTLSIKGSTKTVSEPEETSTHDALEDATAQSTVSDDSETYSRQPTVEDETPEVSEAETVPIEAAATEQLKAPADTAKYWISERSVGEFSRSFSFSNRIDHDNVKASMKDGILNIVVPKAAIPANRRIAIE